MVCTFLFNKSGKEKKHLSEIEKEKQIRKGRKLNHQLRLGGTKKKGKVGRKGLKQNEMDSRLCKKPPTQPRDCTEKIKSNLALHQAIRKQLPKLWKVQQRHQSWRQLKTEPAKGEEKPTEKGGQKLAIQQKKSAKTKPKKEIQ